MYNRILVVGNGFDLAHSLPTRYTDFLDFLCILKDLNIDINFDHAGDGEETCCNTDTDLDYKKFIAKIRDSNNETWCEKVRKLSYKNHLIDYFIRIKKKENNRWIDFEGKLGEIVHSLDLTYKRAISRSENGSLSESQLLDEVLRGEPVEFSRIRKPEYDDIKKAKEILLDDLEHLTESFQLYICNIVNKWDTKNRVLGPKYPIGVNKCICFNYTNTIERFYPSIKEEDICYIHGKARDNGRDNLVLGIDDNLDDDLKLEEYGDYTNIEFKKFYQRIYKRTGSIYKTWLQPEQTNDVIFYGHSLGVADREVIRELINASQHAEICFRLKKEEFGSLIRNLAKDIGKESLIERTGEDKKAMTFTSLPLGPWGADYDFVPDPEHEGKCHTVEARGI